MHYNIIFNFAVELYSAQPSCMKSKYLLIFEPYCSHFLNNLHLREQ